MTDRQLFRLCKKFGRRALEARRKFLGLLPEVERRHLYKKKGYGSVFEFAAKLAGVSREQVDTVLRLERKFTEMPALRESLVKGEISANKLIRVASIATSENQADLAEKAKLLSSRALEIFVKDTKNLNFRQIHACGISAGKAEILSSGALKTFEKDTVKLNENGFQEPKYEQKNLHVQTLELDDDVEKELTEMQNKGIDVSAFLRECLLKRKLEIATEKEKIAGEMCTNVTNNKLAKPVLSDTAAQQQPEIISRYIPAKVHKIIQKEYGTKCGIPDCPHKAENIHHLKKFAIFKSHSPYYLKPLCRPHHELEHYDDKKYQAFRFARV
jgi:hypothetical protein